MTEFLEDTDPRRWKDLPDGTPDYLTPVEFYLGADPDKGRDIVVRVVDAQRPPARGDLEKLWQSMAQTLVLVLAVRYSHKGSLVVDLVGGRRKLPANAAKGTRPRPLIVQKVPLQEAKKFCQVVLGEETPHTANRLVARWMDERATDMPGLKNDGLFARHALLNYVPDRPDWPPSAEKASKVRDKTGRDLVKALGFQIDESSEPNAVLLSVDGSPTASALFLDGAGSFDEPSTQYGAISPVTHALAVARRHRVRWVVLTRKRSIRLHPVSPDLGVGRRGRTTTYIEINLDMLPEERSAFLWLLFSSDALVDGGTVDEILAASERFANDLGSRLRERVYNEVVPDLATALGRQLAESDEDGWLDEAYHRTMVVLFRLLFVAYAEDKGLLPYERNVPYTNASLKTMARELIPYIQGEQEFSADSAVFWRRVVNLWRAVDKGKTDWGIPQYNGGLFSTTTPTGDALDKLELSDADFGPALASLLVDIDSDGVEGPVDFRSLSVREFGSIYEGLLESELAVAETDLTTNKKGIYLPASKKDNVVVVAGEVYFHNASGARKSSGSYFTKPFAVEHLLDHALEPAIADHFKRVLEDIGRGDDAAAARRFFDFRCVDIAMGSGHFLVAAVDRLEARFSEFLDEHPIPGVTKMLETLRDAALNELRHCADDALIENAALLRRQIARRCVYGVDLNPVSVELARLAIWIHTFVPGLPLSFLDHNLVAGNSLTGIGTLVEAEGALGDSIGSADLNEMIGAARPSLERLATVTDATVADIKAARAAHADALAAIDDARQLLNLLVLSRAKLADVQLLQTDPQTVKSVHDQPKVAEAIASVNPLHFPIAFPEVFLRDRPGFDCILGNPPWDTVKAESQKFWGLRFPGIRSLATGEMNAEILRLQNARPDLREEWERYVQQMNTQRNILLAGPYPGLGSGDPDLAEVFAWRTWSLLRLGGALGVVFPRSIMMSAGTDLWRLELFANGDVEELLSLTNTAGWVFDDAEHRYTIALLSVVRTGQPDESIRLRGPYANFAAFEAGKTQPGATLSVPNIISWTPGAAIPLLPSEAAVQVYEKMRAHPAWTDAKQPWQVRTYNELHSTADKKEKGGIIQFGDRPDGAWRVYKGESYQLWNPDTGTDYGWVEPSHAVANLMAKRARQVRTTGSAFAGMGQAWAADKTTLPLHRPRVVWRKVARATDTRSFYAALVPPTTLLADHSYCLFFPQDGDREANEAFMLGMFCSIPFDWHARLWVEANFTAHIVRPMPMPAANHDNPLRVRVEWLAGSLAAIDERYTTWASALGIDVGTLTSDERNEMLFELDALAALLFGLNEGDVKTVFETFHVGWDYAPRLERVLEYFKKWEAAS